MKCLHERIERICESAEKDAGVETRMPARRREVQSSRVVSFVE